MRHRLSTAVVASAALIPALALSASSTEPPPTSDQTMPDFVAGEVLVGFNPGAAASDRAKARKDANAAAVETVAPGGRGYARVEVLRVAPGTEQRAIARLETNPNVVYAEPNWVLTTEAEPTDPYYTDGSLWGVYGDAAALSQQSDYGSQAAEAWAGGNVGDQGVYVAVIDTGVQVGHSDLAGNVDAAKGKDFYNDDDTVYDGPADDHGTHVAGTIGATAGNGGVVGVAHDVGIIPVKFLGPNGGSTADAIKAVDYVTSLKATGVNVVATNNSWGGGGYSSGLYDAIQRAGDEGILFVAAAGNGDWRGRAINTDGRTKHYPSSYDLDSIISVTAIQSNGGRPSWANYGATTVDLGAPGVGIVSTLPDNSYGSYSGTSMATPHVTGAVALYAAAHPDASASEIKSAILESAVPTVSMDGRTVTGGRLDVSGFVGSGGGGSADPPNALPTAAFTWECTGLECTFTDRSSDTDGQVTAWEWSFPDGETSTQQNPTHAFTAAGTYDVTLTVTDEDGGTSSAAKEPVTVTDPAEPASIVATVEESSKGWNKVSVRWTGAATSAVEVVRDGMTLTTTDNDGEYTDNTRTRGTNYWFSYEVCEVDTTRCSDPVVAVF